MLLLLACTSDPASTDSAATDDSGSEDTGVPDTGDSGATDTGTLPPPDWCPAVAGGQEEILDTPASPYLIQHPDGDEATAATVLFLPGGPGNQMSAQSTWAAFFDADTRGYRIVVPYVTTDDYPDVAPDVAAILDEVFLCWGGDAARVHLAGHSNGGYLAYNVVAPDLAERFLTVTGAPGYFERLREDKIEGLAFHNSAGEDDPAWLEAMEDAHADLTAAGFDSVLTIWEDTGHTPGPGWTGRDAMFQFWDERS